LDVSGLCLRLQKSQLREFTTLAAFAFFKRLKTNKSPPRRFFSLLLIVVERKKVFLIENFTRLVFHFVTSMSVCQRRAHGGEVEGKVLPL
jgi:hypothetical protein